MFFSTLQTYIRGMLSSIPWAHWTVIGILSLVITLLVRKKSSGYGAVALGISAFIGLFLLDSAVIIRYFGFYPHCSGSDFTMDLNRIFHSSGSSRVEVFSNFAVYVPFGFFLSEIIATTKHSGAWRWIGLATLAAFGLSLCIELLQLVLHVGFFELTDLVMNTLGAFVGAGVSIGWKRGTKAIMGKLPERKND